MIGVFVLVAASVVLLVGATFDDSWSAVAPVGRVVGVFGKMGSGKTLYASGVALRYLRAGYEVFANYDLDFSGFGYSVRRVDRLSDIRDCSRGVVIFDEAHILAPSWDNKALSMADRLLISQVRKRGLDVYVVSQHPARIAKVLRELLTEVVFVERLFSAAFVVKIYDPDDVAGSMTGVGKVKAKPERWSISLMDRVAAASYQTYAIVDGLGVLDGRVLEDGDAEGFEDASA